MNRDFRFLAMSTLISGLAACGGSDHDSSSTVQQPVQPKVTVQDLSAGSYVVSLGDVNAPTVGKYYAAADGSRLLVETNADDRTGQLYRRSAGEPWVAVPGSATDVSVTLLRSDMHATLAPTLASLAGNYVTLVTAGTTANFSINAFGDISPGASACKLSGKLGIGVLPGTMKVTLAATGCGALPVNSVGAAVFDNDYLPVKFRLITDNGDRPVDLWAFTE